MQYCFGVDLGGTTVKLACFTADGTLIRKWEIPTVVTDGGSHILPDIAASLKDYCRSAGLTEVLGIGIGVPGPVTGQGIVNRCVNLGWGVLDIPKELGALTGLPVAAGNDADVAALGEYWKGGGQGSDSMVLVTLGTGVGGGIIHGGQIIHGAHGASGEIGHMVLNRHETERCGCGKYGCVEQYCSATGIVRMAKKMGFAENLTCKDIFDKAAAGSAKAQAVLEQVYAYLGEFIANVCCVFDPEMVVIGGGVSKAGQPLLDGIQRYFSQYIFHAAADIRFSLAQLGNDAGVYGACKLALSRFSEK